MDIYDFIKTIKTKEDFDAFLIMLHNDFNSNGPKWENNTLERYLNALQSFSKSIGNYYSNNGENINLDMPNWKIMAEMLLGAIVYE